MNTLSYTEAARMVGICNACRYCEGYCAVFPDLPAVTGANGTIIILQDIEPGVRKLLKDAERPQTAIPNHYREIGWDGFRNEVNSWSWYELCERLRLGTSQLTYQSLPYYFIFLLELSVMTPVKYFPNGPVCGGLVLLDSFSG